MKRELLLLAGELARRGESFVVAIVVRREPTSSAHQGDMAIITSDGQYHGWLGGNCTRPAVRREAARALLDGKPRYVSLAPEPDPHPRPQVLSLPMTCHSGGTVDIYLEPVLAAARLLVFGVSPCARALGQLGKTMGYAVEVVDPEASAAELPFADRVFTDLDAPELRAPGAPPYAVVASMGEHDEDLVAAAVLARPAYLGVVASRKRFAQLRETLLARGVTAAALDGIHSPAGLDLGGRGPEELALSILAEIVQVRRRQAEAAPARQPDIRPGGAGAAEAKDPVCGMTVTVASARHRAEWDGRAWCFCNARCRERFIADPRRFLDAAPAAGGHGA